MTRTTLTRLKRLNPMESLTEIAGEPRLSCTTGNARPSITNVLMIDDDKLFLESLCDFLQEDGTVKIIERISSYSEAKLWYSTDKLQSVDAIVLDVNLPRAPHDLNVDKFGLEILEELRQVYKFAGPIIVLTNSRDSDHGREALRRGCNGFLCKHASIDAIPRMVAELKLSLTGEVVLVSSGLKHVVVPEDEEDRLNTESQLMDIIVQNPKWSDIKNELGYEKPREEQEVNSISGVLKGASGGFVKDLLHSAPKPLFITMQDGTIIFVNSAAQKLFGYEQKHFLSQNLKVLFGELAFKKADISGDLEIYAMCFDGKRIPVSVASSTINDGNSYAVHIFTDLTSQKSTVQHLKSKLTLLEESSTRLEELVRSDPLTMLLNRRGLESILDREVSLAKRQRTRMVAVLVDLDDFKSINDTHGHAAGDVVLKGVASALKSTLRASDWLGRIGGDEFLVILPATSLENGAMIAERMRAAVAELRLPHNKGVELTASCSLGCVLLPQDVGSIAEVLELTKAGLKSSKRSGKNAVSVSMDCTPPSEVASDLINSGAFTSLAARKMPPNLMSVKDEFSIVHQIIYNIVTGDPVAVECFSRGPAHEYAMPKDFFALAREQGILSEIDLHCLKTSLTYSFKMPVGPTIHVNLLPSTLAEVPTEKIVELTNHVQSSRQVCLEFSERLLTFDASYLVPKIRVLKEAGVKIALDDVGFGYTSLETLTMFEPDCIKIDTKVVSGIAKDNAKAKTVASIVRIANSLGTVPIAEGIESAEDLAEVRRLGIVHGQGWLWQKPA